MRIFSLPHNRLARLLKNHAKALKDLESKADVTIKQGDDGLEIEGTPEQEWVSELALQAIELGFEPKDAFKLLRDEYYLEVIDLELLLQRNEKAMERLRARIIGSEGKSKKKITELSGAAIAVSDERIGILGDFDDVRDAKEAVTRLLEGAQHASVYGWLRERKRVRDAERMGAKL